MPISDVRMLQPPEQLPDKYHEACKVREVIFAMTTTQYSSGSKLRSGSPRIVVDLFNGSEFVVVLNQEN
jgi:hypothetical protein